MATVALRYTVGAVLIAAVAHSSGADQTVGLFLHDERASDGFTLFGPQSNTSVHLLNNDGLCVHSWETNVGPRSGVYLLPNGNLLRAAQRDPGIGVRIQEFDWDGNIVWEFQMDNSEFRQHHDIEPLPNGNVLFVAREIKSIAEAIAAGRDPGFITEGDVRPDAIVEIRPIPPNDGEVVWKWHVWDHLVQDFDITQDNYGGVADHPELIDINYGGPEADWTHVNSVSYDPEFDQVILSSRKFDEFWVIDHGTTTEEAAGSAGDLLYRWGNPEAYDRGTAEDKKLWGQHDTQKIPPGHPGAGNFLTFNNGFGRLYSSVDETVPPVDETGQYTIEDGAPFGPDEPIWLYVSSPPEDFYSSNISGAERRPEGTTLICEGASGHLFEVTDSGEIVWDYVNPIGSSGPVTQGDPVPANNNVFKIRRYSPDYPAFMGKDLTSGEPIEFFNAPWPVPEGSLTASRLVDTGEQIQVAWDAASCTSFDYQLLVGPLAGVSSYELSGADCDIGTSGTHVWNGVPPGSLYFLIVGTDDTGVYESTWGRDSSGNLRNGTTASFQCGATTKIVSSICP